MMGRAEVAQPREVLAFEPLAQGGRETRFADPGLAADQNHLPLACGGAPPAAQQQLDFLLPPDERGQRSRAQRLEAAQDAALADDAPGALRLGEAGERPAPKIRDLEEGADLPPRALGDDKRIRRGECLKPCGEVRCLADDTAFLRRARADQIADHREAAGDAETHPQRPRRRQMADRVDDRKPGAHRPLGVVLVRLRIAEVDKQPIAHVLRDKVVEAGDRFGDAAVIGADHLPQILGIETRRERRRADQIAEHHRQLAPFRGLFARPRSFGERQAGGTERGGRAQDPLAVPEEDAELFEIRLGQFGQRFEVNRVVAKNSLVLPEPETAQPLGDIHGVSPRPAHPAAKLNRFPCRRRG